MKKIKLVLVIVILITSGSVHLASADINFKNYKELQCNDFIEKASLEDKTFFIELGNYLAATYQTLQVQGLKDWQLAALLGINYQEEVSGNLLEPKSIDSFVYEVAVEKLFISTGTRFKLSHGNNLSDISYQAMDPLANAMFGSAFNFLNEVSSPTITATFVQPLLKNAFGLADRYPLKVVALQQQAARIDVQEAWEKRLSELYKVYLNWAAAFETVQAFQEIVNDLKKLERETGDKLKAGVAEETDVLRIRDNRLNYQSQLDEAEGQFFNLMKEIQFLSAGRFLKKDEIRLLKPSLKAWEKKCGLSITGIKTDVGELRLIRKLELIEEQSQLAVSIMENALMPQVDLIGQYTGKGQSSDRSGGFENIDKKDYRVVLQASIPLGNYQNQGMYKQAVSDMEVIKATVTQSKEQLGLANMQMEETLERMKRITQRRAWQVLNGGKKLKADEHNFRIGRLDTFYLIDSEIALVNARLQKVRISIELKKLHIDYLALNDALLKQSGILADKSGMIKE